MPAKWDEKALADLFISVCETAAPKFSSEDQNAIVAAMKSRGHHDITWNGIRQHIQKLKKKEGAGNGTGDATTPVPATPKGRKAASSKAGTPKTPSKTPRASAKKRKATELASVDDEEDYIKPQEEKDLKVEDASPSFLDDGVDYGEY
ncbi:hypothetical protein F5Y17DRAFT_448929 [Xylariaceae sp. FL0594]|nr:hypothetical protein F5Y17DRAFT_448929 [Xylariaceae sp. FL0594]